MTRLVDGGALVTGAGSGLGRAIALELAAGGAPVAVVDLQRDGAHETAELIRASGGRAAVSLGDVSRWDDVDRLVGEALQQIGPLGILVNAAGVYDGLSTLAETGLSLWDRVVAINLTGAFLCCKRAIPELPAGSGRVVNIASVSGLFAGGGGPAYVASKHGLVGLTRALALDQAERAITVNAVCPGAVPTDLRANSSRIVGEDIPTTRGQGADDAALRAAVPLGRRGTVEEIAAAVAFLASVEAAYITGQTLVVDGGRSAR